MAGRDPRPEFWIEVDGERVYWPEVPHRERYSFEDINFCKCGRLSTDSIHDENGA